MKLVEELAERVQGQEETIGQRSEIWDFYADLKGYKQQPCGEKELALTTRFDEIFTTLVLEQPEVPLHTNGSDSRLCEKK